MWDDLPENVIPANIIKMPDPLKDAEEEAERIKADRHYYLRSGIERIILDAPWVDEKELILEVGKYYKEAISCTPSFAKYPEATKWVDYVIRKDRELMNLADLTEQEIAVLRSTHDYLTFRGYRDFGIKRKKISEEKCRIAFLPETDMGPMHIKNVDDPITYWKPLPALPARARISEAWWYHKKFVIDGVGSGLHIDDEPDDIFPLPVLKMVEMYADNTDSVVDFLRKYSSFWGSCNVLIYDRKYKVIAIEKCSRNYFEVFPVDKSAGFGHVSGMVCRNPDSPQAKYQKEKRNQYLNLFNLPEDGPDALFWNICYKFEIMLRETLRNLGRNPRAEDVIKLFTTKFPDGLRKDGLKIHPDQGAIGYTLITNCTFLEKKLYYRWQRTGEKDGGIWQEKPEICQYEV
ncbi:MAG TPA: hypothetical protein PLB98_05245 [bacterium]|nr:hypothetical protein [bacterium]